MKKDSRPIEPPPRPSKDDSPEDLRIYSTLALLVLLNRCESPLMLSDSDLQQYVETSISLGKKLCAAIKAVQA